MPYATQTLIWGASAAAFSVFIPRFLIYELPLRINR
jgi:hypothetical protein